MSVLQAPHAVTKLPPERSPPRTRGCTWSTRELVRRGTARRSTRIGTRRARRSAPVSMDNPSPLPPQSAQGRAALSARARSRSSSTASADDTSASDLSSPREDQHVPLPRTHPGQPRRDVPRSVRARQGDRRRRRRWRRSISPIAASSCTSRSCSTCATRSSGAESTRVSDAPGRVPDRVDSRSLELTSCPTRVSASLVRRACGQISDATIDAASTPRMTPSESQDRRCGTSARRASSRRRT